MKHMSKKIPVVLLVAVVALLLAVALTACSPTKAQRTKAAVTYGEANAYARTSEGVIKHLANGTVSYYISGAIVGEYLSATTHAIDKANTLTSKVTIKETKDSYSAYKFDIVKSSSSNPNALAYNANGNLNGAIVLSTITYVSEKMDKENLQSKKHTALHEMGHTFGLAHQESNNLLGYSVMMVPHPAKKYQLDDYSEFDRHNIIWYYGA